MWFLDTLKNTLNKVTSIFKRDKDEEEEQVTTPTTTPTSTDVADATVKNDIINNTTPIVPNAAWTKTLDQLTQWQQQAQAVQTELPQTPTNYWDLSSIENLDVKLNKELEEREENRKKSTRERIWDWAKSTWHKVTHPSETFSKQMADTEYQANEKFFNVYYNPETKNMSHLVVSDSDVVTDGSNKTKAQTWKDITNEYLAILDKYGDDISEEESLQLSNNYADAVRWLFSIEEDDYYSDWLFFGDYLGDDWISKKWWRRHEKYTDEQLDALSKLPKVDVWNYAPTNSQIIWYLHAYLANEQSKQDIMAKYWVEQQEDWLDLWYSPKGAAQELFLNRATNWIVDLAKNNLIWDEIDEGIQHSRSIANWVFNRAWTFAYPTFIEAELVKQKQKNWNTLTADDYKILEWANKFNLVLDALSTSVNDFLTESLDKKNVVNWAIYDNLDVYSWGRSLWDVISKRVIEASWMEPAWWVSLENYSWIDAIQDLNHDIMKVADAQNASVLKRTWIDFEDDTSNLWRWGSEIGQQYIWNMMRGYNALTKTIVWTAKWWFSWWIKTLSDYLHERKDASKIATFMDQDFTYGRMLYTEESPSLLKYIMWPKASRTLKEYLYQTAEYAPEVIWNLIPDAIAITASEWVWVIPILWNRLSKVISAINKVSKSEKFSDAVKAIKWITNISKLEKWVSGMTKAINTITKATDKIPASVRAGSDVFRKLLETGVVGQLMDAQFSPYDSEAYSDASYAISIFGSALFDIAPVLKEAGAFRTLANVPSTILKRDANELLTWTVWDTIKFMNNPSNTEALDSIARTLYWKSASNLSFNDYKKIQGSLEELSDIAKKYWKDLPDNIKAWATKWTKENMYNVLSQTLNIWDNSTIGRQIRALITNEKTNPADLIKYLGWIWWNVEVGPWTSTIKLKQGLWEWSRVLWYTKAWETGYSAALDIAVEGWFSNKLKNWFTIEDINKIKSTNWFSDITEDLFTKWDNWLYYIKKEWLDRFGVSYTEMPKELIAREINQAEAWNVSQTFKERLQGLNKSWRDITDTTIDKVAESWTYQEIREKVADIVC